MRPCTTRHNPRLHRADRSGFTLLEVAIVLAIFVVLTTIGFAMTRDLLPRNKTRRAALQFQSNVFLCRNLAVQSGRECRILLVDFDPTPEVDGTDNVGEYWVQLGDRSTGSTTWDTLPLDADEDGTDDFQGEGLVNLGPAGEQYMKSVSIAQWETLGGPGVDNQNAVVFSSRGFVSNPDTDYEQTGDGYLHVTFVNKSAFVNSINDTYIVRIARSGMARVDQGLNPKFEDLPYVGTATTSSSN